jgi:DNA primase
MGSLSIEDSLKLANIPYRIGTRSIKISCPKHKDIHPSLSIYKNTGMCHCYSCGLHISVSQLLSIYFDTKVEIKGGDFNYERGQFITRKNIRVRDIIKLPKHYMKLGVPFPKLKYTKEAIETFNIGYCKVGFNGKASEHNCSNCFFWDKDKDMPIWIMDNNTCFFSKKRFMIPMYNNGILKTIESRDASGFSKKKVLYPVYSRISQTIFNYDNLRTSIKDTLFIVEGAKSAIRLFVDLGVDCTAIFSNRIKGEQGELLANLPHKIVYIIPDNGAPGRLMVEDIQKSVGITTNKDIRVVTLPEMLICKSCSEVFSGDEKKDICPICDNGNVSFMDAFDFSIEELNRCIAEAVSAKDWLVSKEKKPFVFFR